jgi:hypothetical protein
MTQFDDAYRARTVDSYDNDGECDHHYYDDWTLEKSLAHLEKALKSVIAYRIRVSQDGSDEVTDYTILAGSETDARVLAFCWDGGMDGTIMDQGGIELAKTYTEVL